MRSPKSSKSNICTEGVVVYVAGINAEVRVHYPGKSVALSTKRLLAIERCEEGVAEVSRRHSRTKIDPSEGLNIVKPMETPDG